MTDHSLPTKKVITEARAALLDQPEVETFAGFSRRQRDGVHRVMVDDELVIRVPDGAKSLQSHLMVSAHMK